MSRDRESLSLIPARQREFVSPELVDLPRSVVEMFDGVPLDLDDLVSRPEVEVLTADEVAYRARNAPSSEPPAPAPVPLERPLAERPSLVPTVDVDCELMLGLLAALEILSLGAQPASFAVKITFRPGEDSTLYLETVTPRTWVAVSMPAKSLGTSEFALVVPLQRAINVLKVVHCNYKICPIGIDAKGALFGSFLIPFERPIADFPRPMPILTAEVRLALPRAMVSGLVARLGTIAGLGETPGIVLDTARKRATVAHAGQLYSLAMEGAVFESKNHTVEPPVMRVPLELLRYLLAVSVDKYIGVEINDLQVIAGGTDFSAVVMASTDRPAPSLPIYSGAWIVSRQSLIAVTKSAEGDRVRLKFDGKEEVGVMLFRSLVGEKALRFSVKRAGGAAFIDFAIDSKKLLAALEAIPEADVELSFQDERGKRSTKPMVICAKPDNLSVMLTPEKETS